MARTYAQVYLTIWNDPDFRDCSTDAQWLYFLMLTHPTLTSCGVMDWRPARLIAMSDGMTIPRLQHAAWELGQRNLIAVDPDTEEALVRSFVRHDGILKSPNKTKALVREYGGIASQKLMELVSVEVRRAAGEDPTLKGLEEAQPVAKQFLQPFQIGSPMVPEWFENGSEKVPFQDPEKRGNPSKSVPPPSSLIPHPSSKEEREAASHEADPRPQEKRGTRITPDYMPTPRSVELVAKDYPEYDTKAEHPNFVDYWLGVSGQRGVKLDWEATWRKWMRTNAKEAREKQSRGYRNQNQIMADIHKQAAARDAESTSALALIEGAEK